MNTRSGQVKRREAPFKARRRDAAASALMEAAERVFAEKGYDGATMQEIAVSAGCAAGTTYLYFPGKEELFHAIVTRRIVDVSERILGELRAKAPALKRLEACTAVLVAYFNENRDFCRIFYTALPGGRAHVASNLRGKALDAFASSRRRQIEAVREAQRDGSIRRDLPAEELVDFMHGVNLVTFARWAMTDRPPAADEQARMLWALSLGGLRGTRSPR